MPGDGDADVDAEQPGEQGCGEFGGQPEQCCGEFGGQPEQCCRSILAGAQPQLAQSFAEMLGADRQAGPSAGEQPLGGALVAEGRVSVPGGDEFADQGGEGFGQHDGFAAEPELHLVLVGVDVIEGEAADRGRPLRVEQDEEPRDAVAGVDVGLVH